MQILSYLGYLSNIASLAGAAMLILVIWFMGPGIGLDGWYPLETVAARLVAIAVVVVIVVGSIVFRYVKRRRAAKALESGVTAPMADDSAVLAERLKDALAALRKSQGGRGDYLYAIPWYLIIGPPGAGKTTALVNSGLKFPLAGAKGGAMVPGAGGTRYCDWWFTEDAVIIDTAGRYTTQDSAAQAEGAQDGEGAAPPAENLDRKSWLAFLDLLRKHRPRQPVNGVIVAFAVDDLVHMSEAERNAHADAVRTRLVELYERLKVAFPVYVLFTKADLVAGFEEFFVDLRERERRMVWGATFQTEDRTKNTVGEVPAEFDALLLRLSDILLDRLQHEPNQARRSAILGFPAQVNALSGPLVAFMNRVFEPTRYHANAILRGFYFSSGTQEGTAFDQLIGSTARAVGARATAGAMSGTGRSYFLHDLLKKVIFAEAGWVSFNRAAVRRARIVRGLAVGAVVLATAGALAALTTSFLANRALVADMDAAVEEYRVGAGQLAEEVEVASVDLAEPHSLMLLPARTLPVGYETRQAGVPLTEGFGLSQRARLLSASEEAYRRALERSFRSRLILRTEERLQARLDDPEFVYDALKAYKMLGGERTDDSLVAAFIAEDWEENLYAGRRNAAGREALRAHLVAMLQLDAGHEPLVALNEPLVRDAERVLARTPLVDIAFARLQLEARADPTLSDWILVDEAGTDAAQVFETVDGAALEEVVIPAFYTFEGFEKALVERLPTIRSEVEAETWLYGEAADQRAIEEQFATLEDDLLRKYHARSIEVWRTMLARIRLRSMVADKPDYVALRALSSPASPLRQLLQAVAEEVELTREPPETEEGQAESAVARASAATVRLVSGRTLEEVLRTEPGAAVESAFAPLVALVSGEGDGPTLNGIIDELAEIHDRLRNLATGTSASEEAEAALEAKVEEVRAEAARLPDPASRLVLSALRDIEADLAGAALARLSQSFNDAVTAVCRRIVDNRYPFFDSERDVPFADFEHLFAPDGVLATYRKENLDEFIDTAGERWQWRQAADAAVEGLSEATLRQFERADAISRVFFPEDKEGVHLDLTVSARALDPAATSGGMKINRAFVAAGRVARSQQVEWPGENADDVAAVTVTFGPLATTERIAEQGPWSLFRLVDAGRGAGHSVAEDERVLVNYVVGGRRLSFALGAATVTNPLTMRALREFRCPTGL